MDTSGNRDCQWASKRSYSNSIRVGYVRMEQIWEGVLGDGLEGLPLCVQSKFECRSQYPLAACSSTGLLEH